MSTRDDRIQLDVELEPCDTGLVTVRFAWRHYDPARKPLVLFSGATTFYVDAWEALRPMLECVFKTTIVQVEGDESEDE